MEVTMDAKRLLEQFLGPNTGQSVSDALRQAGSRASNAAASVPGGFLGGAAAGGLLGLVLGNKKMRKAAGGLVGYGGAALLGAAALKALQTWQQSSQGQNQPAPAPVPAPAAPAQLERLAADGSPFDLSLVRAMIAAANADGHIGADEQKAIFEQVGKMNLDAEDKAFVFDAMGRPPNAMEIAALAGDREQAAELYLASRMAIDPDDPREQAYLDQLSQSLNLPAGLAAELDRQLRTMQPA
jgi:uncharacterized membrane protein YebE (DUF533 family)